MLDVKPSWELMKKEVERLQLPKNFTNDFWQIDRQIIVERDPECFVWGLRENGTHFFICETLKECLDTRNTVSYFESYSVPVFWYFFSKDYYILSHQGYHLRGPLTFTQLKSKLEWRINQIRR